MFVGETKNSIGLAKFFMETFFSYTYVKNDLRVEIKLKRNYKLENCLQKKKTFSKKRDRSTRLADIYVRIHSFVLFPIDADIVRDFSHREMRNSLSVLK